MTKNMLQQIDSNWQKVTPEIANLILIDRTADLVTPFVTQSTYEGMIDELYGIQNSFLRPPFPIGKKEIPKIWLRSQDTVFAASRYLHVDLVKNTIMQKAINNENTIVSI